VFVANEIEPLHILLGYYFLQVNRWQFGTSGIDS
jgi:hypothetical protein